MNIFIPGFLAFADVALELDFVRFLLRHVLCSGRNAGGTATVPEDGPKESVKGGRLWAAFKLVFNTLRTGEGPGDEWAVPCNGFGVAIRDTQDI
jgi:hypothetical protein